VRPPCRGPHSGFTSVSGESDNVDNMVASTMYLPTHFGVPDNYAEAIAERLSGEIGDENEGIPRSPRRPGLPNRGGDGMEGLTPTPT
jgi:hypothetical protein